jgi:hypothetical protein
MQFAAPGSLTLFNPSFQATLYEAAMTCDEMGFVLLSLETQEEIYAIYEYISQGKAVNTGRRI